MKIQEVFSRRNRILLYELVKTDFKLRYQGSLLGIAWSALKPLLLFAVMYVVFVHFLKFSDGTPQYPIVLLLGITLWAFFSEATSVGMQAIVGRGDILRKINFPKYIVILSAMTSSLISLTINMVVVIIFALVTGIQFTGLALLTPINILQLFLLAFGCSLVLSALYVKFRDISHIWEVVAQILFYATPIFYPLSFVTGRELFGVQVSQIIMLNPLAQTIQDARHNLISPTTVPTTWDIQTHWMMMVVPLIITVAVLAFGVWYFSKNAKKFAEMM